MMKALVIYGIGQLAELATFYAQEGSKYRVVGYATDQRPADTHLGLPLHDVGVLEDSFSKNETEIFVAVSYHEQNRIREKVCNALRDLGWTLASIVSESAKVASNATIGDNCLVLETSVIQPWSRIGDGAVIWSGVQIGHHSDVGNYAFLSAGVVLMGCNVIGERCHLAGGVTVRDHVMIGSGIQIAPGEVVNESA